MTKRRSFMYLGVLLAAALFAFGCGGNDGGLSSEDMARIDAAEMTAEEAKAALAVLQADMDEADTDPAPEADTSDLADQIAVLEDLVADLTAEPQTIPEILGGKKSTLSAADLAVASKKLAGELKGLYDHDGDKSLVNLPVELTEPAPPVVDGVIKDTRTRDVSHASQLKEGTKYFLRHTFAGTGTKVDLSSQGDLDSLKLGKLLTVDGVDLMSVSIKEKDKVTVEAGEFANNAFTAGATVDSHTRTTTRGADGSMSVVIVVNNTGEMVFSETTTFAGGSKIVEYNPLVDDLAVTPLMPNAPGAAPTTGNDAAMVTLADGRTMTFDVGTPATNYTDPVPTVPAVAGTPLPAADLAVALRAYAQSTVNPMQHSAMGYGAWLDDSFFLAYRIYAENDALISDPDETAMKVVWGGRKHDSAVATDLSGRGATAVWKGMMVGHDMDADSATANELLKGNASITARIGAATLADQASGSTMADLVDVSLTNIITGAGTAVARVADDGIQWTNLDLAGGEFAKGSEISGAFYDNGNEVVGGFSKMDITGAFGAVEYMDDTMTE